MNWQWDNFHSGGLQMGYEWAELGWLRCFWSCENVLKHWHTMRAQLFSHLISFHLLKKERLDLWERCLVACCHHQNNLSNLCIFHFSFLRSHQEWHEGIASFVQHSVAGWRISIWPLQKSFFFFFPLLRVQKNFPKYFTWTLRPGASYQVLLPTLIFFQENGWYLH